MSSNSINTVPVFTGANFRTWQQQMGDFLHFQRLWRIISGVTTRPVGNTPADLAAQNAWDEGDEQAQGILGLRLSPNLRTHLGATSALSWTALGPGQCVRATRHSHHLCQLAGCSARKNFGGSESAGRNAAASDSL